jgi:SAM-dependent methyltransferase
MDRDTISAITHGTVPFADPLAEADVDAAIEALELPPGARVLDIGCGDGGLLARVAARHAVTTVGIEPAPARAAAARGRVDVVHEAPYAEVELEPLSFDLVICVAASHALGRWDEALRALANLTRPLGAGLVGEGFWRRRPSAGYLAALGGASEDELPDYDHLEAGAFAAGWDIAHHAIASDADWAAYEETLIANGERHLAEHGDDPDLRAWVSAARERWNRPDGRDTLGFALLSLKRG